MRKLLRCRRGALAFATVIAMVPLIGAMAIGGEAVSWYVTKQHTQNAADAAAYSGALRLACAKAVSSCTDTQSVDYRGKEFAAQNAYCNGNDATVYPGSRCASQESGVSQSVAIDIGNFVAPSTWTNSASGIFVRATVKQTQPAYLTALLGFKTIDIGSQAIAKVFTLPTPSCVLALTGSISFQGSPNINAPNCGLASDDTANNALNFTGGGMSLNVGSLAAAGGCTGATSFCNTAFTYLPPVPNPFSALDSALTTLCGANPSLPATCGLSTSNSKCPMFTAYTAATPCTNNNAKTKGNTAYPLTPGVYFISGTLTLTGGSSITGTGVTFILLPGATIDTKGGGTLTITGPTSAPSSSSLPTALQSSAALFQNMSVYDASSSPIQFGGTSNINFTGNIYAPTADVTFQGNPTMNLGGTAGCGELVAKSVSFNGNATFNDNSCPTATKPDAQYVALVQ